MKFTNYPTGSVPPPGVYLYENQVNTGMPSGFVLIVGDQRFYIKRDAIQGFSYSGPCTSQTNLKKLDITVDQLYQILYNIDIEQEETV